MDISEVKANVEAWKADKGNTYKAEKVCAAWFHCKAPQEEIDLALKPYTDWVADGRPGGEHDFKG